MRKILQHPLKFFTRIGIQKRRIFVKCPKCAAEFKPMTYTGHPVNRCTQCNGLWFAQSDFDKLRRDDWLADFIDEGSVREGRQHDQIMEVHCPECDARMKHIADEKQPHILYETCPNGCGVYFDAGEFKDLAQTTFWDKFKTKRIMS